MAINKISIIQIFLTGILFFNVADIKAQQDSSALISYTIEEVDTSDYIQEPAELAKDYNLMIAASRGYTSEIDRLISEGADINAETSEGATALIFAVSNNKISAVKAILNHNPVIDKVTVTYETPLIIAAKNNYPDICELLIRAGADVDFTDFNGATPLHHACINGFFGIADMLLYYDASIDEKSDDGLTPLMASIMAGQVQITDLLIQNGADREARNAEGLTPFLMASVMGDTLTMDLLFRAGVDIYAVSNSGYNALDMTISSNQTEALGYLLRISDKWKEPSSGSVSPYTVAAKYNRKEMVRMLTEYKIPGKVNLGIDQAAFALSARFTTKDIYMGMSISFKEPYLNAGIIAGCDLKPGYTRVLIKDSENLYYQYMNKGYLAYAGIFKDLLLHDNPGKSNTMLSVSLAAGYSFGNTMKGTVAAPSDRFLLIPDISMKYNMKYLSFSAGLEYIKSDFYKIGPVWMRIGCSYTLYFDRVRTKVKPIRWY